jgi:hypothetical protein
MKPAQSAIGFPQRVALCRLKLYASRVEYRVRALTPAVQTEKNNLLS